MASRLSIRYWIERFHNLSKADRSLTTAISLIIFYLITGTIMFHELESWTWVDSYYFSGVTLLTVGYGDLTPTTPLSKIIAVGYAFAGISTVLYCIIIIGQKTVESRKPLVVHAVGKALTAANTAARDLSRMNPLSRRKVEERKTKMLQGNSRTTTVEHPPAKRRV